ncbi:hypothetical protein [Desulfobacter postgatei]|uniref:hypothetical protein n=1 Tax=Desulfobacter postgatei TaxID=2293 RepID=UPI00259B55A6|nr:hypothetical protein [uncultured Desulfobacter sp.]
MGGYLERLKTQKVATHGTAKTVKRPFDSKDSCRGRHISEIPAPSPAGLGAEYEALWNEAWILAGWIDDPDGAPIEERRAKLPELNRMVERMRVMENTRHILYNPKGFFLRYDHEACSEQTEIVSGYRR